MIAGWACMSGVQAQNAQVSANNLPQEDHSLIKIFISGGDSHRLVSAHVRVNHSSLGDSIVSANGNISRVFGIRFLSYTSETPWRHIHAIAIPFMFSATIAGRDFTDIICEAYLWERFWSPEDMGLRNCYHSELFFKSMTFTKAERVARVIEQDSNKTIIPVLEREDFNVRKEWEMVSLVATNSSHFSTLQVITRDSLEIAEVNLQHSPLTSFLEEKFSIEQVDSISLSVPLRRDGYYYRFLSDLYLPISFSATVEGNLYSDIHCLVRFHPQWEGYLFFNCKHPQLQFSNNFFSLEEGEEIVQVYTAFGEDLNVIPRRQ